MRKLPHFPIYARGPCHRVLEHGRQQVRNVAKSLYAGSNERRLETTFEMPFVILEHDYAPNRRYSGTFNYQKHAFDLIGEMGNEESQCAKKLDDHPNVYRWLRNLSYESAGGFYLPLSPGKFFPDFIVETNDDRTIIVEYKNSTLAQAKEEQHKKVVGEMWTDRSGGKCDFAWIVDRDWATLEAQMAMKQGE